MKLIFTTLLLFIFSPAFGMTIVGHVSHFNDGDTFIIQGQSIRLKGVDAPEIAQSCKDGSGHLYPCGEVATNYLKSLVNHQQVSCSSNEKDQYGRFISSCYVGSVSLNAELVSAGWAVAFVAYDETYEPLERQAKQEHRGMWKGDFVRPVVFRSDTWDAASGVIKGQGGGCLIKGNINSKGVRIYHTPWGSRHYSRTHVDKSRGERWFCSEDEALAAGWRAPHR
ncbi:MAG: thermonuclease family protein [Gammaproteobacteria bacterium]|nr:thermonuclease family protein [Gammaproteobacteria bacterium]